MQKALPLLLLPVCVGLVSCNTGDQGAEGNVRIEIEIGEDLKDTIQVVSAVGTRPDKPNIQIINIDLPREPTHGDVIEKKMSFGGGHFQIRTSPDSQQTTSWNSDNAWVIEITEWNKKPWIEGGPTFQHAGTATGRMYICYKGSEYGLKNSWVSGTFENAAIVYYGKTR